MVRPLHNLQSDPPDMSSLVEKCRISEIRRSCEETKINTYSVPLPIFFQRFYLFIFRERRKVEEREGEKHQCVVAFHMPPTGDLAHNPGMCPDWESNLRLFGLQPVLHPVS